VRWIFATRRGAEAPFHEVFDEQVEGALDEGGEVAAGQCMAHEVTGELEFFLERGVCGELDAVAPRGQGFDPFGARWLEDEWLRRLSCDGCSIAGGCREVVD
jgi:hypothetical protein